MSPVRRVISTSVALVVLRRRLRRSDSLAAPLGLVALDLLGPRIFQLRRLLVWALVLTIVGGVVAGLVWWSLRRRSRRDGAARRNGRARLKPDSGAREEGVGPQPGPAVV